MEERVRKVLREKVNPILGEHYGGAELSAIEGDLVLIKLTGACGSCPSAQSTLENVISNVILEECPEIKRVELDLSVSDDLLDMARKILNKEI